MTLASDRYLDAGEARELALELYEGVERLPIVSPHGHIDVALLSRVDARLPPPGALFVAADHYVVRMLYSRGLPLERLLRDADDRAVWRLFAQHFDLFAGTPTGLWTRETLATVFGVGHRLDESTADAVYDEVAAQLASPAFAPRALLDRFAIEVLATTDAAGSSLDEHRALHADGLGGRVRPTFRPDAVVALDDPRWPEALGALERAEDREIADYAAFVDALRSRRSAFKALGATATDHATTATDTARMDDPATAFAAARSGDVAPHDARRFEAHMLNEFARMSVDDGLVMQLHLGSLRDHNGPLGASFGPDIGGDIPVAADWTRGSAPLLEAYDAEPDFGLIVFTLDESTYSRELAPLAGHYHRCCSAHRGGSTTARTGSCASSTTSSRRPASRTSQASSTMPARSPPSRSATTCGAGAPPAGWRARSQPASSIVKTRPDRSRARRRPRTARVSALDAPAHLTRSWRLNRCRRRRPDPQKRAAFEANRPDEDAVVVRQPVVPDCLPLVLAEHLQPVSLPSGRSTADLTPHDRLEPDCAAFPRTAA